jgi:hypothetical protein
MQLRSGKTTQIVSINGIDATHNARFYGKIHNGNITITMEPCTPPGTPSRSVPNAPGKKSTPTIAKHSMTLRPRKLQPELEKEAAPQHFVSMRFAENVAIAKPKPLDLKDWLVARLKGFIGAINKMTIVNYKERILERTRLFGEMIAVLNEHIEYITSTSAFAKFSHVLHSKLITFKTELTMLLNGENPLSGSPNNCNFSHKERALLGNVRADIVKLSVIMKPLLPELPVV